MRKSFTAKMALACIGFSMGTAVLAAPGHADLYPGACLVVENRLGTNAHITVHSSILGNLEYDISAFDTNLLTTDGGAIATYTGGWNVDYMPGDAQYSWQYDSGSNNGSGCNGSWILTLTP